MADRPISELPDHGNIKAGDVLVGNRVDGNKAVTGQITYVAAESAGGDPVAGGGSYPLRFLVFHSVNTAQAIVDTFGNRTMGDANRVWYTESYISDFDRYYNSSGWDAAHAEFLWPDGSDLYITALTEHGRSRVNNIGWVDGGDTDLGGIISSGVFTENLIVVNGSDFDGYTVTLPAADRVHFIGINVLTNYPRIYTDSSDPFMVALPT